eukprot:1321798-Amorphochlora_amoeboformis.AAC.2
MKVDRMHAKLSRNLNPETYFQRVAMDVDMKYLDRIAERIFQIKVSSSSVERITKHFKVNVPSKRASIQHSRLHKCLYAYSNLRLLNSNCLNHITGMTMFDDIDEHTEKCTSLLFVPSPLHVGLIPDRVDAPKLSLK